METDQAYHVIYQQDAFCVVDFSDRTIVSCQNEINAQHYAELLNAAYKNGYKAGYKASKKTL